MELRDKIDLTKRARFHAEQRLRAQHNLSHFAILILSVYIVILSSAKNYLGENITPHADCLSLWLSVFLIGLTSFEFGNSRLKEAHLMHECALKLNEILRYFDIKKDDLNQLNDKYNQILYSYPQNHCKIDHYAALSENDKITKSKIKRIGFWFKSIILQLWDNLIYFIMIIIPFVFVFIFFPH